MSILQCFKTPLHRQEIEDPQEVQKQYKYWRFRIFYSIYIGYIFYYFTRRSFASAMPFLIEDLGFEKIQLGFLGSVFSISYGLSKFLSGGIADRANPRYFMAFGLLLTGISNILFGLSSTLTLFALFWGLNGWFQGWGAPPCARLLTYWYSHKERGSWWGIWNTSHSLGGFLIPFIVIGCALFWGWRWALFMPGILCIFAGFFLVNRLRDTPQSLGLPPVEKFKNDFSVPSKPGEDNLSLKELLFTYVLSNKLIWLLGCAYFFIYIIRMAISDWGVLFLVEAKEYSVLAASASVACLEAGGVIGSLVAGWASDKIFLGKRAPVSILFTLGVVLAIIALWLVPGGMIILHSSLFFVAGFLIFGPQMLIGIAAVEFSHKKAAGTATGFVGWIAYLGAAVAGYPLGWLAQTSGWEGFIIAIAVCGCIAELLLLLLWKIKSNPQLDSLKPSTLEGSDLEPSS